MLSDCNQLSKLTSQMRERIQKLEIAIDKFDSFNANALDKAKLARDEVVVSMNELRKVVDEIETRVDSKIWPMPTYVDLLFGI